MLRACKFCQTIEFSFVSAGDIPPAARSFVLSRGGGGETAVPAGGGGEVSSPVVLSWPVGTPGLS